MTVRSWRRKAGRKRKESRGVEEQKGGRRLEVR